MYRDLVKAPEQIEAAGASWWIQQFFNPDGTFDGVNLYDADGDYVGVFESMNELDEFLKMIQSRGWEV